MIMVVVRDEDFLEAHDAVSGHARFQVMHQLDVPARVLSRIYEEPARARSYQKAVRAIQSVWSGIPRKHANDALAQRFPWRLCR
jgi:hypothetical protein